MLRNLAALKPAGIFKDRGSTEKAGPHEVRPGNFARMARKAGPRAGKKATMMRFEKFQRCGDSFPACRRIAAIRALGACEPIVACNVEVEQPILDLAPAPILWISIGVTPSLPACGDTSAMCGRFPGSIWDTISPAR
jgi:hypothetical protein